MSFISEKLETFVKVAETKSFTKAAEELSLTQPAVSHHIKKLEEELSATLFVRKKGDLTLTNEGEIAYLYAKRLLAVGDEMREKVKDAKNKINKIRVGITHTQESGFIVEALAKSPMMSDNINITYITDNIKNLYAMLENFEIDMAFTEGKPTNPNLNYLVLDADSLLCIVSADSPLAKKSAISLSELKAQHLILRLPSSSTREKFNSSLQAIGESPDDFNVVIEVDSIATIKSLVKKNLGVSILAKRTCLKDIKKRSLVALPIENLSMIRETTLVYHKTFTHTETVEKIARAYINALAELK